MVKGHIEEIPGARGAFLEEVLSNMRTSRPH